MLPGMTIPGASISGIVGRRNGGTWNNVTTNVAIAAGDTWDVAIPYYPATYYAVDSTCTAAEVTSGACATAPDGQKLRRYEIKTGVTFPSGRTYAAELQNFANWFTYYRKRKLMLAAAMGQVLSQVRDVRGGVVKFNATSAVTMYDFNATADSQNYRQLLGTVYTNPSNGGTPTRDALNYIGQQYLRTDGSAPIQYACQRNAAFILTDGFANASGPTVASLQQDHLGQRRALYADLQQYPGRYRAVLLHRQPAADHADGAGAVRSDQHAPRRGSQSEPAHEHLWPDAGIQGHDLSASTAADRQSLSPTRRPGPTRTRTATPLRWTTCGTPPSTDAGRCTPPPT